MKKWIIFLSSIVVVLAVGAGSLYYYLNVKEYKTADPRVDNIVKTDYNIKLPDEKTQKTGSAANAKGQEISQTVKNVSYNTSNKTHEPASAGAVTKTSATNTKPTAASIIAKYQPAFQDLEDQAASKLSNLLSYAMSEYQEKKASGEDVSYFYFYSKYNGAAKRLEASTDNSFYYIYNALVKELGNYGYSADEAKPIKNHYVSLKKQKRSALMDKAVGALK
ncbi:hypothetical protein PH210_16315 [Paenibacillus sp. BSR1-1]|uniref:hypothetical protein n=1 Tax=Paenibacillus sp. BSR1-1 TaxID=3020845 RepID=UPI0025B06EEB|nr:hypothetical protein [Paenibacillus sp. BSR1-1]MDN3017764.1 hypothetical protein [Paenibacillus sp. BSR1-1]